MSIKRKKVLSILLVLVILGSLVPLIGALPTNACDTGQEPVCDTGQEPGSNPEGKTDCDTGQEPGSNPEGKTDCDTGDRDCCCKTPAIKLTKSGPETAQAGSNITYTFTVSNTGKTDLSNVTVTDSMLGMTKPLGNMAKGCAPITFTQNYTIPAGTTGSIKNTATAKGKYGCTTVSSTACWTVKIPCEPVLTPNISLTKSGPAQVNEGGTITYNLVVTNTGNAPLTNVTVSDPMLGGVIYGPASLAVGQSSSIIKTYTLAAGEGIPGGINNTATAVGKYNCTQVSATASWHVNVITQPCHNPSISIEKSGTPDPVQAGGTINYTLLVTNTGDVALSNVIVQDSKLNINQNLGTLGIGETRTINGSYTTAMHETSVYNKATVEGTYESKKVTDWDDCTICVVQPKPALEIIKDGPASACVGEEVTYNFSVTNTGPVDFTDVVVIDSRIYLTKDLSALAKGETKTFTQKYTVVPGDGNLIVNTATANGYSAYGFASDTDSHEMTITNPSIDIVKNGPGNASVGDTITYTFNVINNGNVTLNNVVVTDPKLGLTESLGTMTAEASTSFTATYVVQSSDLGELMNTATVTGDAPCGQVEDKDVHKVVVNNPGIELVKSGPETACVGDKITYTFTVTNTGTVPFFAVSVHDPMLDWYVVDYNMMLPGGSLTWEVDYVIEEGTPDPLHNTATAAGCTLFYGQQDAEDSHVIDILNPAVEIDKSGPEMGCIGQEVTYEFTVTNTGDAELNNLVVTDDVLGDIGTIESLAAGESTTLTKNYKIKAEDSDPLINTATVTVVTPCGETLTATDTHILDVMKAEVDIEKTGVAEAYVGDEVEYEFKVTNTGEVILADLVVTDDVLGTIGSIESLEPAAFTTLKAKYVITSEDGNPLVNVAKVTGKTPCGVDVADIDDHELVIKTKQENPVGGIEVEKTVNDSDETVTVGDEVSYTLKVTNTGATAIPADIKLTDSYDKDYLTYQSSSPASDDNVDDGEITWADISEGNGLEPGESISVTVNFLAKDSGETENTAVVSAKDDEGTELNDNDNADLTIMLKQSTPVPTPTPPSYIAPAPTQSSATTTTASLPYTGDNLSILIMMAVLMMTSGPLVMLIGKARRRSGK